MSGLKRKASRAPPYEKPTKLKKNNTVDTVANKLGLLKTVSTQPMKPLKFPSLRRKGTSSKTDEGDTTSNPVPPKKTTLKRKRTTETVTTNTVSSPAQANSSKLKRRRTKIDTVSGLPLPKWPTLKRQRTTAEKADNTTLTAVNVKEKTEDTKKMADDRDASAPPQLRRAPTVRLSENKDSSSVIKRTKSLSTKGSSLTKTDLKICKSESSKRKNTRKKVP